MLSRMVSRSTINEMSKTENVGTIVGSLLQTDYRKNLDHFGGENIRGNMIDFALNMNFEQSVSKLIDICPKKYKERLRPIVSRGDYLNINIVLKAKTKGWSYDSIAKYIVPSKKLGEQDLRAAMEEQNVEGAARRLMKVGTYSKAIGKALAEYSKSGKVSDLEASMDRSMFESIREAIKGISKISKPGARLVMLEMEMNNILTAMRAKRGGMSADDLKIHLSDNGITSVREIISVYNSSKNASEIAKASKRFKLAEISEKQKENDILPYEIEMRRQILQNARSAMIRNVLSFAVIIAYYYIKEMEISSLRSVINGKTYKLGNEEIERMIVWR